MTGDDFRAVECACGTIIAAVVDSDGRRSFYIARGIVNRRTRHPSGLPWYGPGRWRSNMRPMANARRQYGAGIRKLPAVITCPRCGLDNGIDREVP
jgi:hypothetical protein